VFIHFDLKSYAKASLKAKTTRNALKRLATTIAVAETSTDWRDKFAPSASNYVIHGGLFVYNHDNEDEGRIEEFIAKLNLRSLPIPERKRLYVFTPRRINYLLSVLNDLKCMIADELLPGRQNGSREFFYQYGFDAKPVKTLLEYATVEHLLGPLIIQRYRFRDGGNEGFVVHYDGAGAQQDEFIFLFELLLKRGLLVGDRIVHLRLVNAVENAAVEFEDAKFFFVNVYHNLPAFQEQLDRVRFCAVRNIIKTFSTVQLGMER
jgi:hypothetical protein